MLEFNRLKSEKENNARLAIAKCAPTMLARPAARRFSGVGGLNVVTHTTQKLLSASIKL